MSDKAMIDSMFYDNGYHQGRTDERPKAFAKGYDSGYQQGRADAIKEMDLTIAYVKGRADLLRNIRECAEHLGYDDIEDLLSYVEDKEQKNE